MVTVVASNVGALLENVVVPVDAFNNDVYDDTVMPGRASSDIIRVEQKARRWVEVLELLKLAGPLFIQNLCGYGTQTVAVIFIGHLNEPVLLSGIVMGSTVYNVTGLSVVLGLASGMETLCGQAYGAQNYSMLGEVLQRALLICFCACVPVTLLWLNVDWLLVHLHQPPDVTVYASRYLRSVAPVLWMHAVISCLTKYLMAQGVVQPGMWITVLSFSASPPLFWLLIHRAGLKLDGATLCFAIIQGLQLLGYVGYILWRSHQQAGSYASTWGGWTWRCLRDWGAYLHYGLPSAVMMCLEWWVFEVTTLLAGLLPDASVAVGVMGIGFQVAGTAYMSSMALGSAANTRVANSLGAGSAKAARHVFHCALQLGLANTVLHAVVIWTLREQLSRLFSDNPQDRAMATNVMPAIAGLVIGDGMTAVLSGLLRGAGRQTLGAALNLLTYWCVGLPTAVVLAFHYRLGAAGFWMGLAVAATLQASILLLVNLRMDWQREVSRAERLVRDSSHWNLASQARADDVTQPLLAEEAQHSSMDDMAQDQLRLPQLTDNGAHSVKVQGDQGPCGHLQVTPGALQRAMPGMDQ